MAPLEDVPFPSLSFPSLQDVEGVQGSRAPLQDWFRMLREQGRHPPPYRDPASADLLHRAVAHGGAPPLEGGGRRVRARRGRAGTAEGSADQLPPEVNRKRRQQDPKGEYGKRCHI